MEYPPGFGPPGDPPRFPSPQREEETGYLTGKESKEAPSKAKPEQSPKKAAEILKASGSETKGQEPKHSITRL